MAKATHRPPTRGLTEGAILAALTVIVAAAGLFAPAVGVLLAPLPIMLLTIRWGPRVAILAAVVAAAVLLQFVGPSNALPAAAMFGPPGLALGWGIWRGLGAELTILAGAAAFLLSTSAVVVAANVLLHQDFIGELIKSQMDALRMAASLQQKLGGPSEQITELRQLADQMPNVLHALLPVILAGSALVSSYLCYAVARAALRRVGHALPATRPILTWRVPPVLATALLWISGGLSLASLRLLSLQTAAFDAMLATLFVFGFQGALVGIKWLAARQIPRFAIVLAGLLLISSGPLPIMAVAMLGVLDTWFDYRKLGPGPGPDRPPAGGAATTGGGGEARPGDHTKAVHPR